MAKHQHNEGTLHILVGLDKKNKNLNNSTNSKMSNLTKNVSKILGNWTIIADFDKFSNYDRKNCVLLVKLFII